MFTNVKDLIVKRNKLVSIVLGSIFVAVSILALFYASVNRVNWLTVVVMIVSMIILYGVSYAYLRYSQFKSRSYRYVSGFIFNMILMYALILFDFDTAILFTFVPLAVILCVYHSSSVHIAYLTPVVLDFVFYSYKHSLRTSLFLWMIYLLVLLSISLYALNRFIECVVMHMEKLYTTANIDGLTGFYKYSKANTVFKGVSFFTKSETVSLILIDIVGFKEYINIYGNDFADNVLKVVSNKIEISMNVFVPNISTPIKFPADQFGIFVKNRTRYELFDFCNDLMDKLENVVVGQGDNQVILSATIVVSDSKILPDSDYSEICNACLRYMKRIDIALKGKVHIIDYVNKNCR